MNNITIHYNSGNNFFSQISILFSISMFFVFTISILEFQDSYGQTANVTENNTQSNIGGPTTGNTSNTTGSEPAHPLAETMDSGPLQIISNIRNLLNQTVQEYSNQNYSGAEALATEAYLDNYEYVEAPLAEKDRTLMETTEVMMREELRQLIGEKVPVEEIQEHIDNINNNLAKAEGLLGVPAP